MFHHVDLLDNKLQTLARPLVRCTGGPLFKFSRHEIRMREKTRYALGDWTDELKHCTLHALSHIDTTHITAVIQSKHS